MVAVPGRCRSEKYKEFVMNKIKIHTGLNFNTHILNFTNDGCNTMKKVGRLIKPILMQLCLSHVIHLSVCDVFFKKKAAVSEQDDDDEEDEAPDQNSDDDESEDEDDDYDDDNDDFGIIDEIEEIPGEFSDVELAALIDKCRKIVKAYSGRSTIKVGILQDAIKDWQKKNGMPAIGSQLAGETKTRWNSTAYMLESLLKVKIPLKKVLKDSNLALSEYEFEKIAEILKVLLPVKDVVEAICREDADLMVAETAFNELFKTLKSLADTSMLAQEMLESLRKRVKSRWNPIAAGLLKYLHNPKSIKPQPDLDEIFKAPSRKKLEEFAIDLLCRHFGEKVSDENPQVVESNDETEEMSFAEKLKAKLNELSENPASKKMSFQDTIKKEMDLFQITHEKSKNLNLLYTILQNISPTSVASERAFSNSNDFVTKKRACLSDESIDSLCFLKGIFKD